MIITNKVILFPLLLLSSLLGYSQDLQQKEDTSLPHIENTPPNFFFGFSYIKPIGSYAKGDYSESYNEYGNWTGTNSVVGGVSFEIGNMFWFDELNFLPKRTKLGIMAVYASPQLIFDHFNDFSPFFFLNTKDILLSFKVGPSFAYSITRNLYIEADFAFEPTFFFKYANNPVLLMRYNPRINLRFKPIYLGVDFSFGRYQEEDNYSSSLNQMRITFGFNF